ncbi:hypothetical protein [Sphingobium sp. EP60837]|uniref:hypothetical protein n=1 Tax=Sphingobium sp. EP60837 TaxID=1855519 RepID=UPI0007DCFE92|nr:hypothetical protein [Sphingobium sp. EP60837]ANI79210.1 hypothetical protein EP837_02816 [Sphingobium sp. EP60837]
MDETDKAPNLEPLERPKIRDWFWRPWYAKLWIALILLVLLLGYVGPRDLLHSHEDAATLTMALVLNPYLFICGLGFGYFRAAWKHRFGPMRPLTEDEWEWHRRHRGNDPTDPGNSEWLWHPMNPMSDSFRRRLYGDS